MTITPDTLSYPVLCIPESLGIYLARDRLDLERCQAVLFWKAQLHKGMQIVDSSGHKYVVTKATISKPASNMAKWFAKFLDLPIHVRLELEERGIALLTEITKAIDASIKGDPEAFEELSGKSIEWWRAVLAKSADIKDILKAFSEPVNG